MRKFVKRLTAVMLSLAMVAACALQVGAEEGADVKTFVLKHTDGLQWLDSYGEAFDEAFNDYYQSDDGYKVNIDEGTQDITVTPTKTFRFYFSFSIARNDSQKITLSSDNLYGGADIDTIISDTTFSKGYVTYKLTNAASLQTSDASGALNISAEIDEVYNITLPSGDGIN